MSNAAKLPSSEPTSRQRKLLPGDGSFTEDLETRFNNVTLLLQQAPALVALLRGRNGIIELCNDTFCDLWDDRPMIGLPMRKAWPELAKDEFFDKVEDTYHSGNTNTI